jgi:hypothetical protein
LISVLNQINQFYQKFKWFFDFFSRLTSFAAIASCTFLCVQCLNIREDFNTDIYAKAKTALEEICSVDNSTLNCMVDDLMLRRIIDRFYTPELLNDLEKLKSELGPYVEDVKSNCQHYTLEQEAIFNNLFTVFMVALAVSFSVFLSFFLCFIKKKFMKSQQKGSEAQKESLLRTF